MTQIKILTLIILGLSIINSSNGSPKWSKNAVWYQIFPERFRNGDTTNDPTKETLDGTWPFDPVEEWSISPWGSDWYKMQEWEIKTDKDFYYNAQRRRYGGDIQGIIDKLDYLNDLGVNALYLNPVFESPSLHKYGATLLHHIDNNFGPNPENDIAIIQTENPASPKTWQWTSADKLFLDLIKECHSRDMKIIIDGVFNHVGIDFWALKRVRAEGPSSSYTNWFTIKKWDDPTTIEDEFEYEGWSGHKGLPEFKQTKNSYPESLKSYFKAIVKRWMDPNNDGNPEDGIDGWRLDVAAEVPINFWKEFRKWVKEINPDSYITGEIWWEDYKTNKLKNASKWIKGDAFDSVMNYRFADNCYQYFIQTESPLTTKDFTSKIKRIHSDYGYNICLSLQNLLGSHDTQRVISMIENPNHRLDHGANLKRNRNYAVSPLSQHNIKKADQLLAYQFFSPGAPYIYYGDEVGMWGADDPDCRKPMIWDDIQYEDEHALPYGNARKKGYQVSQDKSRLNFFKRLCAIRKSNTALRKGDFNVILQNNRTRMLGFRRTHKQNECLAFFNSSDTPQEIPKVADSMKLELFSSGTTRKIISSKGFVLFVK